MSELQAPVVEYDPPMSSTLPDSGDSEVELDTIFRTLVHPMRRRILTRLTERRLQETNPVSVDELAPTENVDEQFHIKIYHTHLPRLDTIGFIDWNHETDTIAPGPHNDTIHEVITLQKTDEDRLPTGWP